MAACPECGVEIRDDDATIDVKGVLFHPDCVGAAHAEPETRERRHARTIRAAARLRGAGSFSGDPEMFGPG